MPDYKLYMRGAGGVWTYSGYKLKITGSGNSNSNGFKVRWRLDPPGSGPWTDLLGATRNGTGNPDSPQNGDGLDLPATIGTVTNINGEATYSSTGDPTLGAGYFTTQGAEGAEGDWCAGSN
jgi:hypothetical protein